jgi:hypothetical protein
VINLSQKGTHRLTRYLWGTVPGESSESTSHHSGFVLPADTKEIWANNDVDASSLFMPITRPAQLIVGLGLLLVVSFVLIHPSSSLSVPYSDFWQTLPTYTPPAVFDSDNRHLTSDQCHERYPGLFHEADLARKFYQKKGGISLEDVDKADQDGGASARLAIINNKVRAKGTTRTDASSTSRLSMEVSILERTLLLRPFTGRCWGIPNP